VAAAAKEVARCFEDIEHDVILAVGETATAPRRERPPPAVGPKRARRDVARFLDGSDPRVEALEVPSAEIIVHGRAAAGARAFFANGVTLAVRQEWEHLVLRLSEQRTLTTAEVLGEDGTPEEGFARLLEGLMCDGVLVAVQPEGERASAGTS